MFKKRILPDFPARKILMRRNVMEMRENDKFSVNSPQGQFTTLCCASRQVVLQEPEQEEEMEML